MTVFGNLQLIFCNFWIVNKTRKKSFCFIPCTSSIDFQYEKIRCETELIKDPFKKWLAFLNLTAVCDYKGMKYTTGQKWQDGCQYDCECIDGSTGQYRCTEKYVKS